MYTVKFICLEAYPCISVCTFHENYIGAPKIIKFFQDCASYIRLFFIAPCKFIALILLCFFFIPILKLLLLIDLSIRITIVILYFILCYRLERAITISATKIGRAITIEKAKKRYFAFGVHQ